MRPHSDVSDPRLIKALAHPLRVRILELLETRELASPSELADELGVSLGVVSYHVRRLHALGLLELAKRTPRRGAIEHHYRAKERPRLTDERWAETPAIVQRALLAASLRQIGGYVDTAAVHGGFDAPDAVLTRTVMTLDERGWRAVARASARWVEALERIERDSAERLGGGGVGARRGRAGARDARSASPTVGAAWRAGAVTMLFDADGAQGGVRAPA